MALSISSSPAFARAVRGWSRLGLDGRYAVASLPVLVVATLGMGAWVTRSISQEVIGNTAVSATVFVDSAVSPELQGLATRLQLNADESKVLTELLTETPLGRKVLSFKVWVPGGRLAYSSLAPVDKRVFEPSARLREAWNGKVSAELSALGVDEASDEHGKERGLGVPLLEVYMPVRAQGTEKVIAVAEFYQDAGDLKAHLARTRSRTWLVVAAVMFAMYGLLFAIVHAGGRLIRSQASQLSQKVAELSELLDQNEALRVRVGRASRRITESNEKFLRRLSADLHDGPAQALSLALLRLDNLKVPGATTTPANPVVGDGTIGRAVSALEQVRNSLQEAMQEIRQLSRGLSVPELAGLSMRAVVERAAASHQRRTRTAVELDVLALDGTGQVSMPVKLTAYRFTQEALMNAFRHAQGKGQAVAAWRTGNSLAIRVSDRGPGMREDVEEQFSDRMGLSGIRERVEVLGGQFRIESSPGEGTTLLALLPLE